MSTSATRGVIAGLIGGLLGTVVMDLFGAGLFLALGGPASLSFAIIGDAAAVSQLALLRGLSTWKGVGLGVLYVEVMSQPLLVVAALILRMTTAEVAQ